MKLTVWMLMLLVVFSSCQTTKIFKRDLFHTRKKRYLTFPEGSTFIIQLSSIVPLMRYQPRGYSILQEAEYYFYLPSDTRWMNFFTGMGRDKRHVHDTLETGLWQSGLNGTACLKRMLCEAPKYWAWKGKSLIKDILLVIFSFDDTFLTNEETCSSDLFFECSLSILDYLFFGKFERMTEID